MFSKYPTSHFHSLAYDQIISLGSQNMPKYLYLENDGLIRFGFQKFRFKLKKKKICTYIFYTQNNQ